LILDGLMSELLLELFSEEIPSRMQQKAGEDLARLMSKGLEDAGLQFEAVSHYESPRRLCLVITGLPDKSCDVREERKGPRVDAPEKALEGFLRSTGLTIEECEIHDDKKGQFYVAVLDKEGQPTTEIVAQVVAKVVHGFPWPKSMRWGAGRLKWVRPLHSILCVFDGKHVPFSLEGIASDDVCYGHRFLAPASIKVTNFADYKAKLADQFVILDAKERAAKISKDAKGLAKKHKLALVDDDDLLKEVAGLVEWPVVLMGSFDKAFLDVPSEVLISTLKKHQKCFSLTKKDKLSNHFVLVANLEAEDGGVAIVAGNERVIRARLSDAKFFWDNDLSKPLEELLPKLEEIVFHAKLGNLAERTERLQVFSGVIAPLVGADKEMAIEAAKLAKADLVAETVLESGDMQGIAGRYLALAQGKPEQVAHAIGDHYKPQGPSDDVPDAPVSIAVALAEKIELLTSFWVIDEKPTGSKDPFALRRAALGVIRLILENEIRLPLSKGFLFASEIVLNDQWRKYSHDELLAVYNLPVELSEKSSIKKILDEKFFNELFNDGGRREKAIVVKDDLLLFFAERLKVYLRDRGARHDLIDAVFSMGGQDDLLLIVKRVEALSGFLESEDGTSLLAGVKRAQNILRIEEGKDKARFEGNVDDRLLKVACEKALHKAIVHGQEAVASLLEEEDFAGAMGEISKLRAPVDDFFETVIVNDDDKGVRKNRLELLGAIRALSLEVADFSKIDG